MIETEFVQWDSISKESNSSSGEGGSEFLRLQTGNTYKIRPIFGPVKFFKNFHKDPTGRLRTAICGSRNTCPVRDRHPDLKRPALRYATIVIDRNDDNKVKILEAPQTVFRPIGLSFEATGKNPGGSKEGSDWNIKVSGKGLNTTYDVVFVANTPLAEEERQAIKEAIDGDKNKLKKMFKIDTPEEIEEKLFGELKKKETTKESNVSGSSDFETTAAAPPTPTTTSTIESGPGGSDDFDNNW